MNVSIISILLSQVSASQKFQRFMIYVHAKGMIVDDEYVILGLANINQRSIAGSRDTEIALGAYQPHYTWGEKKKHPSGKNEKKNPRGQIYGYRMSLWAEHLDVVDDCFVELEELSCVRRVNKIAEENWKKFTMKEFTPLQGHLLKYPIKVDMSGKVSALPGQECFPDVGGKVLSSRTNLPDALTT